MNLVFDGLAQPIGFALHSLLALIPFAIWFVGRYLRKRPTTIFLLVIAAVWFVVTNGIQIWDQIRVRKLVENGDGIQITRGVITESWHIETRKRDWSRASLSYTRTVSEGFDVAGQRFSWNIGDSFSPATFSNGGSPGLQFPKGEQIEVTWFTDPAADNTKRIIRLRMGALPTASSTPRPSTGYDAFHQHFVTAFTAGDTERLTALTEFPFLFGGHKLEATQAPTMWAGLLAPGVRDCLATTASVSQPDGSMTVSCHQNTLVFSSNSAGHWHFVELR